MTQVGKIHRTNTPRGFLAALAIKCRVHWDLSYDDRHRARTGKGYKKGDLDIG
jgi:hypothetical protein